MLDPCSGSYVLRVGECGCFHKGPFGGCPYNKHPSILGSILGPLICGNSNVCVLK